jgi:hypothetical protein
MTESRIAHRWLKMLRSLSGFYNVWPGGAPETGRSGAPAWALRGASRVGLDCVPSRRHQGAPSRRKACFGLLIQGSSGVSGGIPVARSEDQKMNRGKRSFCPHYRG